MDNQPVLLTSKNELEEVKALLQISQMLAKGLDAPSVMKRIADTACVLIDSANQAVIYLLRENTTILVPVAIANQNTSRECDNLRLPLDREVMESVLATGKTITRSDTSLDKIHTPIASGDIYRSFLVTPIESDSGIIGLFSIESEIPHTFSTNDERLLSTLGEQVVLVTKRGNILQDELDQKELTEALRQVGFAQVVSSDLDSVLDRFLEQIARVIPYDIASVLIVENEHVHLARMVGKDCVETKSITPRITSDIDDYNCLKEMMVSVQPLFYPEIESDPVLKFLPDTRSWLGAPISAQGIVMAFFSLSKFEPGFYHAKHAGWLSSFAGQAALTLQNARLLETTQRRLKEVNILYQISQCIGEAGDLTSLLQRVISILQERFNYYFIRIYLVDKTSEFIRLKMSNRQNIEAKQGDVLIPGLGIPGYVYESGHHFVTNNVGEFPFFTPDLELPLTIAEMAIPLKSGDRLLGVLDIHHKPPDSFTDHDLQIMLTVADQLTIAIDKMMLYADLQTMLLQEQAARAQLVQSEKLAALGRIVASVAHELNNPLQAIQNALYLISHEDTLTPQSRDDLQVALNEADRMAGLISRLREIYRPTTGDEYQYHSLNDLILEVQKLLTTHLRRNNVLFKFVPDSHLPSCPMLQDQIKQVILNISLNAIEAMTTGGTLFVKTFHEVDDRKVVIIFTDTGPGIPQDVLSYIFDPFTTTKERGTGLGLAITYDIVHRHGGEIEVESNLGQGTSFYVKIPLEKKAVLRAGTWG